MIGVLTDKCTGNNAQSLALAETLGIKYNIWEVKYNFLAHIPNFLLYKIVQQNILHINKEILKDIKVTAPQVVICSGRRLALVAYYIKKILPHITTIQILNPEIDFKHFDLVVLPTHDTYKTKYNNVINTIGAINNISQKLNNITHSTNELNFKNFIGVLVGGNSRLCKFSLNDCKNIKNIIDDLCIRHNLPAVVVFSRRTPIYLKQILSSKYIVYNTFNDYLHVLLEADFIICTGDSISICSEVASSNACGYVFIPQGLNSKKHKSFIQQLVDLKVIRILNGNSKLEKYKHSKLNEVTKVADHVKALINDKVNLSLM